MSTDIRVALVFEQDAGTQALRTALANAGVAIALECQASALDASRLRDMHVDAIVVNLDPELEELLDQVTEALDSATQPVIYNDPAASSDLSGWDRARWMRHLSAKLKGQSNVTPPPPPGAELIPVPVQRVAAVAAAATPVAEAAAAAVESIQAQPAGEPAAAAVAIAPEIDIAAAPTDGGAELRIDLGVSDLDLMFDEPSQAEPSAAPSAALTIGEDLGDLDALFAESEMVDLGPAPTPVAADGAVDAPADVVGGAEFDLDALFVEEPTRTPGPATSMATESELTDIDALFREFEASAAAEQPASPGVSTEAAGAPREAPEDWSLEPLQDLTLDDLEAGASSPPDIAARSAQPTPGPAIPADLEASLALADLKLFDDEPTPPATPPTPAQPTGLADFDSLDFTSLDLDSGESGASLPSALEVGEELSLADLDFGLVPGSSAAPTGSDVDADVGDLESLFEPAAVLTADGLALPDLDRVYVLGASIGGPEAIKAFLAQLPASVPAAFVVAQHMGAEFLEMMAVQLDSASPLPVRCPKAGERLRHGEVVVAPANEQLSIDEGGHVQLGAAASGSPYNPSIDHLVRAMADRFGDRATLILFSGMGTDAIEGGRYLSSRGGQVWAQDRSTCVIASMIDSAKSQGLVRFEGTPAQLAERVLQTLS